MTRVRRVTYISRLRDSANLIRRRELPEFRKFVVGYREKAKFP